MSKKRELEDYWLSPAWSQSRLKAICGAGGEDDSSDTKETFRGSLIDSLCTSPELVSELYYVGNETKPSDTVQKIIKNVFNRTDNSFRAEFESYRDEIIEECKFQEYQSNYKEETLWNTLLKSKYYWDDLTNSEGKIVVSQQEMREAEYVKKILIEHPLTSAYFKSDFVIEIKYQTPVYAEIEGLSCKGLPDILIFNHSLRTLKEVDLKTTGVSRQEFPKIARRFRYDFQKAFYKQLLIKKYPDWQVIRGEWLVVPKNINKPFILPVSEEDYYIGEYGATRKKNIVVAGGDYIEEGDYIMGWRDAIEKVKQCKELGVEDYDLEYYQSGGLLPAKSIWT